MEAWQACNKRGVKENNDIKDHVKSKLKGKITSVGKLGETESIMIMRHDIITDGIELPIESRISVAQSHSALSFVTELNSRLL